MGIISKVVKLGITGLGIKELNDYRKEMNEAGKDPWSPGTFFGHFGNKAKDAISDILSRHEKGKEAINKNIGGMAYARKKNMGLKMKKGGSVTKRKARGTGAAKRGTKFKGTF
jgi:hypothetical protein